MVVEAETGDLVGRPPGEGTFQVVLAGQDSTGQTAFVVVTLTARGKVDSEETVSPGTGSSEADPPLQGRQTEAGEIILSSNYPNPFHGTTVFHCRSPTPGCAQIYTLLGHCVRRWVEVGGAQTTLVWDGRDASGRGLPSGIYFLVFDAGGVRMTRRIALIR
ncbi:MAG: T9SS type A sorting domain-containing protein [Candidatus Latescibacteria bacterium]|nr:T9SS type A sorting domain-containing protein [Candidatus Latescibacterota bacterium]